MLADEARRSITAETSSLRCRSEGDLAFQQKNVTVADDIPEDCQGLYIGAFELLLNNGGRIFSVSHK